MYFVVSSTLIRRRSPTCGTNPTRRRGSFPLRTPAILERWVLSKPYFDPEGLIVAVDDADNNRVVGYALAGFGPNEELERARLLARRHLLGCGALGDARKQLGAELVKKCEELPRPSAARRHYEPGRCGRTVRSVSASMAARTAPASWRPTPAADPFFRSLGYEPAGTTLVFQKKLDAPISIPDARFGLLRKRYETQVMRAATVPSWWHECVWGTLDPVEFRMVDKLANSFIAARAIVWELEGYNWRWGYPVCGRPRHFRFAKTCGVKRAGKTYCCRKFCASCRINFSASANCMRPPTTPRSWDCATPPHSNTWTPAQRT